MHCEPDMNTLCGARLLTAWDRARNEQELARALTLLEVALPDADRSRLALLPLRERNRLLLEVRLRSFGGTLEAFGRCAICSAAMEFSLPLEPLLAEARSAGADEVEWMEHDVHLRVRPVNTLDLMAARDAPDAAAGERLLLTRCCSSSTGGGVHDAVTGWPSVRERFELLHTGAEVWCTVACPHCLAQTSLELDIAHFLWLEVRRAAECLLGDVHTLARQYGWRESDIVELTPQRRQTYIEMIAGSSV